MNEVKYKGSGTSKSTLWLKKSELEAINELIERLDVNPTIKEQEDWVALKTILTQKKEMAKAKTYFFTGKIIKKGRERFKSDNISMGIKIGDEFWILTLDNNILIYCAKHNLDDPTDYERDVLTVMTGEKYEFEVELWVDNRYRLRKVIKKVS